MRARGPMQAETRRPKAPALTLKAVAGIGVGALALPAILIATSGRPDWAMAWVVSGVVMGCLCANGAVLMRVNPDVLQERLQLHRGAEPWDVVLVSIMGVFALGACFVAGLDRRFGWSPPVALPIQVAALAVVVLGDHVILWAMAVNRFFSKLVRIQRDRAHRVVTQGPYRCVRHPGYVGWIVMCGALPVALGSLWALVPAALTIGVVVVRTALEDRTLLRELEGYAQYARRVRYRLLPGVW